MSDLRPANALAFAYMSVDATVAAPGVASPATTTAVVWLAPSTARLLAGEPIEDQRWRVAIRRDHVSALEVGSVIHAARPPEHPTARDWIVDRVEDLDPDVFYAQVH